MQFQNFFTTILGVAGLLISSTLCAAQLEANDFLVTALSSYYPSNTTNDTAAFLTFTIYDPDPVTNQTTECGASWYVLSTQNSQVLRPSSANSLLTRMSPQVPNQRLLPNILERMPQYHILMVLVELHEHQHVHVRSAAQLH